MRSFNAFDGIEVSLVVNDSNNKWLLGKQVFVAIVTGVGIESFSEKVNLIDGKF